MTEGVQYRGAGLWGLGLQAERVERIGHVHGHVLGGRGS
jgi:hypothetical protein